MNPSRRRGSLFTPQPCHGRGADRDTDTVEKSKVEAEVHG